MDGDPDEKTKMQAAERGYFYVHAYMHGKHQMVCLILAR
jgi:hypothetical protein